MNDPTDSEILNYLLDNKLKIDKSPLKALLSFNYWCTKEEALQAIKEHMKGNVVDNSTS
jgi:hypothetical protein